MRVAAEDYARTCSDCHELKPRSESKRELVQSHPVPEKNWTDITMDFFFLTETQGRDSSYVIADKLSEYVHFIPCSSSFPAEGVT